DARRARALRWTVVAAPPATPAASATPATTASPRRTGLQRHVGSHLRHSRERTIGQPLEANPQAGGDITDGVEGLIVGDDLELVPGAGAREPAAGGYRDAQVAPVPDPDGRRAVHQLRTSTREQPRGLVTDDPPVADGDQLGVAPLPVEPEHLQ